MEFQLFFYFSTPVKVQSNDYNVNNSNDTANTKVKSVRNGSYIAKTEETTGVTEEVTLNNLKSDS